MWTADKVAYRLDESFTKAYHGEELVWDKNVPADTELWYTSTDGNVVTPELTASTFWGGANIVSNTYSGSKGIITFDRTLTEVGNGVFSNKSLLRTITFPLSVTTIGQMAFEGTGLINVTVPAGVSYLTEESFENCTSLTSVTFEQGVQMISRAAFSSCNALQSVTFPSTLTTISKAAFYMMSSTYAQACPLSSVTLPSSLTYIGELCFKNCENLSSLTCLATTPPECGQDTSMGYGPESFIENTPIAEGTGYIYVPSSSVSAYQSATGWSTYASQIRAIS